MKKNLKRLAASLLAAVMILCTAPVNGKVLTTEAAESESTVNIGDCIRYAI